ncbi:DNA methyltransferase [Nonlabens sp. YIK11]|uniref:class I SAM-dependent DNA methyltransferase n=1 Tax=Nonlabens sp. YIK11 TaxID=1453349 RepID=UPI0006DCCC7B|nr:N-6 DNA methylase [Nonlabens sp. YIK11]KQC34328.1 DNA methyltransferase [Nonlabens sp. YIK11]
MSDISNKITRLTDILRRDDGISGAMHYTEQISWVLFLKFLNDYEAQKADEAIIENTTYKHVLPVELQWPVWACPKDENGKPDVKRAKTGDELKDFVNETLFPYLKSCNDDVQDTHSMRYKIGAIFEYLDNRIVSGHTLREVLDIIDSMNFQSQDDLFELSRIYEDLLKGMGSDGGNSGEFYTPRAVITAMVQVLDPQVGETVYDGAVGSAGFLVEAFEHMRHQEMSASQYEFLQTQTFYGMEKTSLGYVMGMMNMILHGIESPNVAKGNTLAQNIMDYSDSDRHDVILANPPFGGKENAQMQANFTVKSNATELLFMQHFMKRMKVGGRAAILIPEGILFQSNNAFAKVKQDLLHNFNLHTVLSLPSGVFLPYSGVKTNVIFFERAGSTCEIWYYEVNPAKKLTKNNPITADHLAEFIHLFNNPELRNTTSEKRAVTAKVNFSSSESRELFGTAIANPGENDWTIKASDIKDYDLSAKNPHKVEDVIHRSPQELLSSIKKNDATIKELMNQIESLIDG